MKQITGPSDIKTSAYYTLWQHIGSSWLVERSYPGAFFKDPEVWSDIKKSQKTNRPYAVFLKGYDPNKEENESEEMGSILKKMEEAEGSDSWDEARRMIENPEELYLMLSKTAERIIGPAVAKAQDRLKGYSKVGIPNRIAPDLLNNFLFPAVQKYADEISRAAKTMSKKFQ